MLSIQAMNDLCRLVPLLPLLLSGCWDSHDLYEDREHCSPPPGTVCCSDDGVPHPRWDDSYCPFECPSYLHLESIVDCVPTLDAGAPAVDAGPWVWDAGPDAEVPDAGPIPGLMCEPVRAGGACSDAPGLVVVEGQEAEFAYRFDECGCCPPTECVASVDAASRRILFTTALCPDTCDCDTCETVEGRCTIPPLPFAGEWQAWMNGAPAVRIPVRQAGAPGEPNPPGCSTFAEPSSCGSASPLQANPWQPTETCVRDRPDRRVIELVHTCGTCDYAGPCISYLVGDQIIVQPSRYASPCELCDDSCHRTVMQCEIPPLPPGSGQYLISVGGDPVAILGTGTQRNATTACAP